MKKLFFLLLAGWACSPQPVQGQPAAKLGVGGFLHPSAQITLEGTRLTRSAVLEDPGFRLQYHVQKDGKTLDTPEARAQAILQIPTKEPGLYTVVLELFYPSYKPGKDQKGQYKPISNTIAYRVAPGKPLEVFPSRTALSLLPGQQKEIVKSLPGYNYKWLQGTPSPTAFGGVAWTDPKMIRFDLSLPKSSTGTLWLTFPESGPGEGRKLKILLQGKQALDLENFTQPRRVFLHLSSIDTQTGVVQVTIQNANTTGSAILAGVELQTVLVP